MEVESIIEKLRSNKLNQVYFTPRVPLLRNVFPTFCEALIANKSLTELSFGPKSLSSLTAQQFIELLSALAKHSIKV